MAWYLTDSKYSVVGKKVEYRLALPSKKFCDHGNNHLFGRTSLSDTVLTGHLKLLNPWNVASAPEELKIFMLLNFN